MTVISLSSIPPRFGTLGVVLRSLVAQSAPLTEIRLNIPKAYRRFPQDSFSMPDVPDGVRIAVVDEDLGPATKVLPTLLDHAGTQMPIIFGDDDRVVHPDWASNILAASAARPEMCICNAGFDVDTIAGVRPMRNQTEQRAVPLPSIYDVGYKIQRARQEFSNLFRSQKLRKPHRLKNFKPQGYVDVFEGCGGVLIKPGFLDSAVYDLPDKVWMHDDLWMSAMAAKAGTKIWANNGYLPRAVREAEVEALYDATIDGMDRHALNLYLVRYIQAEYGVWAES
jgi:hypothetical protein|tara:strand:+ start:50 stop:892 length:843 start_codon:yes stop_codon:yes gene_type:complete